MRTFKVSRTRFGIVALFLAGIVGFGSGVSDQGVILEVRTTSHVGSDARVETVLMSILAPDFLKMEILSGDDSDTGSAKDEMIFRGDRKQMIVVDHAKRSYMIMDDETIEKMGQAIGEAKKMAQNMTLPDAVLKNMSAEQRKQFEDARKQMQGGGMPGGGGMDRSEHSYKNTGERSTREGYPCVKYDEFTDAEKVGELWVTDWDNVEGGGDVKGVFREMESFFRELMEVFGNKMGGKDDDGFFGKDNNPMGEFLEVDGIPVVSRSFEDGELESESVLKSARRQNLDPAAFEPPSGYKRMSMGPQ